MFDSAFDCSFSDCIVQCAVTFVVVLLIMGIIHIWIYFKLVKLAKARYGIAPVSEPFLPIESQLDTVFKDPYPGITRLEDVQEEELWKLYKIDKKKGKSSATPVESKYFNLLSTRFLRSKGYTDRQISNYRIIPASLSKSWN